MPVLAGREPGAVGESFPGTNITELQHYRFSLSRDTSRQWEFIVVLLQPPLGEICCSQILDFPGCSLLWQVHWSRDTLLQQEEKGCFPCPHLGRAARLNFKYLLDICSNAHYLGNASYDGCKSKGQLILQEAGLEKAISTCSLLGTHFCGIPPGVTFLPHCTLNEAYPLELARQLN